MTAVEGGDEVTADVWRGFIARPSTWLDKVSETTINERIVHMVTANTQGPCKTIDGGEERTGILTGDAIKYFQEPISRSDFTLLNCSTH